MPHGTVARLAGLVFLAGALPCAGQTQDVVAIDILIEPDSVMASRAVALNARLRRNYPAGFALDATHVPHITLVQRYVRVDDIAAIGASLRRVITEQRVRSLRLTTSGYGGTVWHGVGLVDYTFEPSPALHRLADLVIAAVEPFAVRGGTGAAFQRDTGEQINAATIAYVEEFVPRASGQNFRPHITLGNAQPGLLSTLQAEPFARFDFAGKNLGIYQLGNFATARTRLWSLTTPRADSAARWTLSHLQFIVLPTVLFAALLGSMLAAIESGRRLGRARLARNGERAFAGLGAMEGAVFALMGLLLAFSFSHSADRLDERRRLLVDEANALGTAWLRLDLLHDSLQPAARASLQNYVRMRLTAYRSFPDYRLVESRLDSAAAMQRGLWDLSVIGARRAVNPVAATQLVLAALNQAFDLATTRRAAITMHTPTIVFVMLTVLALASSVLAGVAAALNPARNRLHRFAFALLLVAALYVIIDLEFPRFGFVRIDDHDQLLASAVPGLEVSR